MLHEKNPHYIHHQDDTRSTSLMRELVFGMEDGMVSTLGSITGIAAATHDPFTTILAGVVIISVESISMGVGAYLSSKSVRSIEERKLHEETQELHAYPEEEQAELVEMYVKDGWSRPLAEEMAKEAAKNKNLFLQEMAYRELKIIPGNLENPLHNGLTMWVSYIAGGAIPLVPFFIAPIFIAIPISIAITLVALFSLGVYTAKFSKRNWLVAGLEMFTLASVAAGVGYIVGQIVDQWFLR